MSESPIDYRSKAKIPLAGRGGAGRVLSQAAAEYISDIAEKAVKKRDVFMLPSERPVISIIIPTLNEAESIGPTLKSTMAGTNVETIVVDGGSSDGTAELAKAFGRGYLLKQGVEPSR